MAAAGKGRVQPGCHDVNGCVDLGDPATEDEDIGIIVFTSHAGGELIGCQCRSDQRVAVGGDGHADAGAADENASGILAAGYQTGQPIGISGVINGSFRVSSQIGYVIGAGKGGL